MAKGADPLQPDNAGIPLQLVKNGNAREVKRLLTTARSLNILGASRNYTTPIACFCCGIIINGYLGKNLLVKGGSREKTSKINRLHDRTKCVF